jgi:hypothetical protein
MLIENFYLVTAYQTGLCGALSITFTQAKSFISYDGSNIVV